MATQNPLAAPLGLPYTPHTLTGDPFQEYNQNQRAISAYAAARRANPLNRALAMGGIGALLGGLLGGGQGALALGAVGAYKGYDGANDTNRALQNNSVELMKGQNAILEKQPQIATPYVNATVLKKDGYNIEGPVSNETAGRIIDSRGGARAWNGTIEHVRNASSDGFQYGQAATQVLPTQAPNYGRGNVTQRPNNPLTPPPTSPPPEPPPETTGATGTMGADGAPVLKANASENIVTNGEPATFKPAIRMAPSDPLSLDGLYNPEVLKAAMNQIGEGNRSGVVQGRESARVPYQNYQDYGTGYNAYQQGVFTAGPKTKQTNAETAFIEGPKTRLTVAQANESNASASLKNRTDPNLRGGGGRGPDPLVQQKHMMDLLKNQRDGLFGMMFSKGYVDDKGRFTPPGGQGWFGMGDPDPAKVQEFEAMKGQYEALNQSLAGFTPSGNSAPQPQGNNPAPKSQGGNKAQPSAVTVQGKKFNLGR